MSDAILVTVKHVRAVNFCARGARVWFERHGLDYSEFVLRGLPVEQIEATGDELGRIVAKAAREDAAGELDG